MDTKMSRKEQSLVIKKTTSDTKKLFLQNIFKKYNLILKMRDDIFWKILKCPSVMKFKT